MNFAMMVEVYLELKELIILLAKVSIIFQNQSSFPSLFQAIKFI